METMAQELNINNHTLRSIQKMFCDYGKTNVFYNTYTLMDVEENKNKVYLELLRKYNYQDKESIQIFIDNASNLLSSELFKSNEMGQNTEMVGVKNIIKDPRKLNKNYFNEIYRIISIDSLYRDNFAAMKFTTVALVPYECYIKRYKGQCCFIRINQY